MCVISAPPLPLLPPGGCRRVEGISEERASSKADFAWSDQPRWIVAGGGLVDEGLGRRCGDSGEATREVGSCPSSFSRWRREGESEARVVSLSVYLPAVLRRRWGIPLPLLDGLERREPASLRSIAPDQGELVRSGEASREEFGAWRRWAMMSAASKGAGRAGVPALSFLLLPFLRDMTCG